MRQEPPTIDYGRKPTHPDRWQWGRMTLWLTAGCLAATVYLGLASLVLSVNLATPTPAYAQFRQRLNAQAATRPAGTAFAYPAFPGQAYVRRPLLSLPTTYAALAFAAAGVALFVLHVRQCRRA